MNHTIRSSHGLILVNETGRVIIRDMHCTRRDKCDNCIIDILKFNFEEFKKYHNTLIIPESIDILDLGYWEQYHNGDILLSGKLFGDTLEVINADSLNWATKNLNLESREDQEAVLREYTKIYNK